jgi:hypothetical protein
MGPYSGNASGPGHYPTHKEWAVSSSKSWTSWLLFGCSLWLLPLFKQPFAGSNLLLSHIHIYIYIYMLYVCNKKLLHVKNGRLEHEGKAQMAWTQNHKKPFHAHEVHFCVNQFLVWERICFFFCFFQSCMEDYGMFLNLGIRSLPLSRSRPIYEALGGEGSYADVYRHKIPPPLKE